MNSERRADSELLKTFVEGDESAFVVLVQRHLLPLRRFLLTVVRREADVDDIVQETFQAVFKQADSFEGEDARPWIFGIGRRQALRSFRKRSGEPEQFEPLEQLAMAAGWGDPEGALNALEDKEVVRKALAKLPIEAREVLLLRDVEGFTTQETATILGLAIPAVKSRLHRARLGLMAEVRRDQEVFDGP